MLQIHTDVPTTRRKRLHHVTTQKGELLWSGSKVGQALDFIFDKGNETFELIALFEGGRHIFQLRIQSYRSEMQENSDLEEDLDA